MNNANDNGERKVVNSLRDLPTAVQPSRDLWAGIEARIVAEGHIATADAGTRKRAGSNLSRLRWMAAAAVVAALAVGMWVGRSVLPTTRPTTSPGAPRPTASRTTRGCASTPRRPRTSRCRAR